MLRYGLIGAGRIGRVHLNAITNFIDNAEVTALAEVNLNDEVREVAKKYNVRKVYNNYKEILTDKDIDAVLVCSSTDTHSTVAIDAARAGKHIFCEKPIDFDLAKIRNVITEVEKSGVKFQIGFQRRFDHNFKALHQAVISGRIGELQYMNLTSRGPSAPPIEYVKVSGGIFMDMMIHDFDMARFLSQSEVTEVYAKGGYFLGNLLKDAGDYDSAIVEMTFKTGAWGTIHNARDAAYGYDQRAEIFGSKGMMLINNDSESNAVFSGKDGVTSEKPLFFFLERYTPAYAEEIRAFTNAVINKTPSPVNAFDGLQPVIIALACLKSAKENRVVKISEIS